MDRTSRASQFARSLLAAIVALAMAISALGGSPLSVRAWHEETLVVANRETSTAHVGRTVADRDHILWERGGTPVHSHCKDIVISGLDDRTPVTVARVGDIGDADLNEGRVLWGTPELACDDRGSDVVPRGLHLTNVRNGTQTTLIPDAEPVAVAVEGDLIAWVNHDPAGADPFPLRYRLMVASLDNVNSARELAVSEPGEGLLGDLRFDGEMLYWQQYGVNDGPNTLYSALPTGEPSIVQVFHTPIVAWDIAANMLATLELTGEGGRGVVRVRNLQTDVAEGWTISEDAEGAIATDGRYVLWASQIDIDPAVLTVEGYDLMSNSRFIAAEYLANDQEPTGFIADISVSDGTFGWSRWGVNQYQSEVHAASLADRLSTAYRPDPGIEDPRHVWFSETGHSLARSSSRSGLRVVACPCSATRSRRSFAI